MTSPISKLDADVSYIITSMLDKKDLSSFMKTCHTIYHTGIPQLLSGDVSIHSYLALESFQRFMFAEVLPPTDTTTMARRNAIRPRFKFLHGLNIQFWTRPRTEPLILADIVEKSIELRRLMLPRCDETIFYLSTRTTQRIADVLDTLPVLQKLFLSETKALHTPIILTSLRRPTSITELSLIINSKVNFSSSSLALSSIRNTLTKLTLNDQILHHGLINHPSDVSSIPFTKVQELTILTKGIHVDRILVFMVQTFPSLKRLSFTQTPTLQTSPTSPSLQTLRESNQTDYFQRYRNNLPVNGVLMKSLESCSGETGHLYSLGLTIPIRQLSIRHCLDREQISLLRDVLEDVGPSVVGLRFCGWDVLSGRLGLREIAGGASASITRGRESLAGIFLEVVMYDHDLENYSAIWVSFSLLFFLFFSFLFFQPASSPQRYQRGWRKVKKKSMLTMDGIGFDL